MQKVGHSRLEERRDSCAEAYNIGMAARSMHRPLVITLSACGADADRGVCRRSDAAAVPEAGHVEAGVPTARRAPTDAARPARGVAAADHGAGTTPPTEATLGVPIYPGAEFVGSYDAGRGQRYYLFGTNASFLDIVNYYKNALKQKGELIYEEPPIHEFDIGKFKEETMAFPPSVTVKDYTWGGSAGYLNPKRGATAGAFQDDHPDRPGHLLEAQRTILRSEHAAPPSA